MPKKTLSQSSLINKLDRLISEYVRRKSADEGGTVECVTCKRLVHWKDSDCGHFIKRQHMALRFDERNLGTQCRKCNRFQGGRQDDFAAHILNNHGKSVFDEMMTLKYQTRKWNRVELEETIERYREKLKEFE